MEEAAAAGLLRSPRANKPEFVQAGEKNLAEGGEGYLPMSEAPRWLGFGRVLWMDDGLWEGEKTTLTYDLEFGLRREVKS